MPRTEGAARGSALRPGACHALESSPKGANTIPGSLQPWDSSAQALDWPSLVALLIGSPLPTRPF